MKKLYAAVQARFGRPADVVLNNAALAIDTAFMSQSVDTWWKSMDTNGKGLAYMVYHFIATQPNPEEPVGTIISVLSGRVGLTNPNASAYNTSKAFELRLVEHLQVGMIALNPCFGSPYSDTVARQRNGKSSG